MKHPHTWLTIIALAIAIQTGAGQQAGQTLTGKLGRVGTTRVGQQPSANHVVGRQLNQTPEVDLLAGKAGLVKRPITTPALQPPNPGGLRVGGADLLAHGWDGLNALDQVLADNGNQFDTEPPDPAMAVGGNYIMQAVNNALAIYDKAGNLLSGPTALNPFFGLPSEVVWDPNSGLPLQFGPFTSDPKCYFDPPTGRWFVSVLEVDTDPSTGTWLGTTSVMIAVSQSSDPTGGFVLYQLDTTASGLPDQPLIGADSYGFFISYNSFLFPNFAFNGGEIVAISKAALVNGTANSAVLFAGLTQAEGPGYSIQPATVPPGGSYDTSHRGTEYFLSALDFLSTLDNRITAWAITGTRTLDAANPTLLLRNIVINCEVYGQPPLIPQRNGMRPLGELIANGAFGPPVQEPPGLLESNDDRMNQVIYAAGKLFGAVNTIIQPPNGVPRVGIAYFIVTPGWQRDTFSAQVTRQGYVAVSRDNVFFPGTGINSAGKGVMTFTLAGPSYHPSAAFVFIDATAGVTGLVRVAAAGNRPFDSFTCYPELFGSNIGRWGDYHTAFADVDGSIWFTAQCIRNGPRSFFENWSTFIGNVVP
ncbi:MAG: hypothetical protein HY043_07245 [Verrucomicrobia bacterium]|nr:hypothetical protein [Verrucomicrobiota bacterium]